MRKAIWILALAVAVLYVPTARADGFDASFTCDSACSDVPTDPYVTFPGPTIPISFLGQSFSMTLNLFDKAGDQYAWTIGIKGTAWYLIITDLTNGLSDFGQSFSFGGNAPFGGGTVHFDNLPANAPEPSSTELLLLGVGMLFAVWKLKQRGLPQAS
ncbi:MAG TPA: PEP-CTERM sorting domain-containing protein [Patescibacteria group bacterium]|nr:PEP-CTERM sorting domain-containing protein [Patescibacteria group bacterium]